MPRVAVRILDAPLPLADVPGLALGTARRELAQRHGRGFEVAGADDVRLVDGQPDGVPFGARLRGLVGAALADGATGLVVLGSGAIPLATVADRRRFVAVAASGEPVALANNRYSADVLAIGDARILGGIPDLPNDNRLPRWLAEEGGVRVDDLRRSWRLQVDLDSPIDLVLIEPRREPGATVAAADRVAAVRRVGADARAEVVVAGRTSAASLRWLERHVAARVRAFVEERGLRTSPRGQRPPQSVLGMLLDEAGPGALGRILARLGDAALVDTRVLLAHRAGADDAAWPAAADRFASDLLDVDRVRDAWLRELTRSARDAPIPVVLGGHTLVGPGIRLVFRPRR